MVARESRESCCHSAPRLLIHSETHPELRWFLSKVAACRDNCSLPRWDDYMSCALHSSQPLAQRNIMTPPEWSISLYCCSARWSLLLFIFCESARHNFLALLQTRQLCVVFKRLLTLIQWQSELRPASWARHQCLPSWSLFSIILIVALIGSVLHAYLFSV
jgi:hypothetical protein